LSDSLIFLISCDPSLISAREGAPEHSITRYVPIKDPVARLLPAWRYDALMMYVFGALLSLSLTVIDQSAAKPNFSGEWTMNVAKSDFGAVPAPESMTRSITHSEPSLTIVEAQKSALGDQSATRKYVTDGSETTFEASGATVATSARWAENTLVVISKVDVIGLTFNDVMSLSPDGKTMTSKVRIGSAQGDMDVTIVFEKQ
jgi:hypothetical protein